MSAAGGSNLQLRIEGQAVANLLSKVKMSSIDVWRDEYPDDASWARFVDVFRPSWELGSDKRYVADRFGDEEIAIVLMASLKEDALDWFSRPSGALGKRSPADILQNEAQGLTILRTLQMRMPR